MGGFIANRVVSEPVRYALCLSIKNNFIKLFLLLFILAVLTMTTKSEAVQITKENNLVVPNKKEYCKAMMEFAARVFDDKINGISEEEELESIERNFRSENLDDGTIVMAKVFSDQAYKQDFNASSKKN